MTDEQVLYATLCVLYLLQCLHWVRADAVAFRKTARSWQSSPPSFPLAALRHRVIPAHVLPTVGQLAEASNRAATDFDARKLHKLRLRYRRRAGGLDALSLLLFANIFAVAPILVRLFDLVSMLPLILPLVVLPVIAIIWIFYRAHRALLPAATDDRWQGVLTMALYPIAAARVQDLLWRKLFAGFHPLVVARELLSPQDYGVFAERTLRELRFGDASDAQVAPVEDFLRRTGLDPEALLSAPAPLAGCHSYCPRCVNQYTIAEGQCSDCGITLWALTEPRA